MHRALALPLFAAFAVIAVPDAHGHGLAEPAPDESVLEFGWMGTTHMLAGWDHLLFITGVVLLAGSLSTAAELITAFVVGHSLTLVLATLAGWQLDARLVDVVIALSVVYVGAQGLRRGPGSWRAMGAVVFGFGLVHGLGLSTRLQAAGLPEDGLLTRVIAFNVGVEVGQLVALTVILAVGTLIARGLREPAAMRRPLFGAMAATGCLAAVVLALSAAAPESGPLRAQAGDTQTIQIRSCTRSESATTTTPAAGGAHPAKAFYEPREAAPEQDLAHVIGDGYVIVRYRADVPGRQLRRLSRWIMGAPGEGGVVGVVAVAARQTEAVRATTASRNIACRDFDLAAVRAFSDEWFADLATGSLP